MPRAEIHLRGIGGTDAEGEELEAPYITRLSYSQPHN
jgi:hypothetical protein